MRESTRGRVLSALLRSRPASRKQLAEATDISAATVSRTIDQLIVDGFVVEGSALVEERRGRRQVLLDVVADKSFALGIDMGASRTRCVLVDLTASPVSSIDLPNPVHLTSSELAVWIGSLARHTSGAEWPHVGAVALGLPGAVSREHGTVSNAPNLPQIETPGFFNACAKELGRPVVFDNDANYALLGEQHFGAASGLANAAMVTLGAGLGVGLSVDGRIVQGTRGLVGEFGQLPVGPGGARLETLVTGPGILRRAEEAGLDLQEPADLFRHSVSPMAGALRMDFDRALVVALAAVSVACDPDVIVIGGGIAKSLRGSLDFYQQELTSTLHMAPSLVATALGDFAGAAGAAVGALHLIYADFEVSDRDMVGLPAAGTLTADSVVAVALPADP